MGKRIAVAVAAVVLFGAGVAAQASGFVAYIFERELWVQSRSVYGDQCPLVAVTPSTNGSRELWFDCGNGWVYMREFRREPVDSTQ